MNRFADPTYRFGDCLTAHLEDLSTGSEAITAVDISVSEFEEITTVYTPNRTLWAKLKEWIL